MIADAFNSRQAYLTGEVRYHPPQGGNTKQAGTQGRDYVMPYADESVVVNNPRPMKAGNSLEEKTAETQFIVIVECSIQKILYYAKGRRQTKECERRNRVTVQVKTTEAGMPRGTVMPGMTNLLA